MVFRTQIAHDDTTQETLQVCSQPIICSTFWFTRPPFSFLITKRNDINLFLLIIFLIIIAQPPGVPEICKKSLITCPATGGLELYIIGKNFLKDTRVIFQARRQSPVRGDSFDVLWEETVIPDKEFLQQVISFQLQL